MTEAEDKKSDEPAARKSPLMIGILLACALAGGGAGLFVAVPMLRGNPSDVAEAGHEEETKGHGGGHGKQDALPIFTVDNLVLNPRDTNGTRFLMVSAAFELDGSKSVDALKAREAEVRDILTRTFGAKSVEELADLSLRDGIRADLAEAVGALLPSGAIRRVYLPQFVIQ